MLNIPTLQAKAPQVRANRQARLTGTPEAGLGTQPTSSSPLETGPGMTSLTPTTTTANPWMSYDEYFAGNPEAQKYSMYHSPNTTAGEGLNWGDTGGVNPYQYSNEYNQYKEGLPLVYQDLINYGVSPEQVASGQVHSLARAAGPTEKIPTDPTEAMNIYGSTRGAAVGAPGGPTSASGPLLGSVGGMGSQHSLDPTVINRMWR